MKGRLKATYKHIDESGDEVNIWFSEHHLN